MRDDEYYVVRIPYDTAGGIAEFWREETTLDVPSNFSSRDVGFADRHYDWSVQVMLCTGNCQYVLADDKKKAGRPVGGRSEMGRFYWHPDVGGAPVAPAGTPTSTPIPTPET